MNTGVALLLKRMESHPEEFIMRINHGTSQWGMLIHQFEDHLDEEDHVALKAGIRKCHQEVFTGKVMQALTGEDVTSEDPKLQPYQQRMATAMSSGGVTLASTTQSPYLNTNGVTGTVTLPSGSITLGNTTLEEEQLKQMKAHLDAHREAMNKVEVNKKPLIKRIFK